MRYLFLYFLFTFSSHAGTIATSRLVYSSTNVGTVSWVQLIASTTGDIREIGIFDCSGQTMELGTGAPSSEVRQIIIPPGGIDRSVLLIPSGTRISIRAISGTANSCELDINYY